MFHQQFAASAEREFVTDYRGCGCPVCKVSGKSPMSETAFGIVDTIPANPSTTATVAAGGTLTAFISPSNDVDVIGLDVVAGQTYSVTLRGSGEQPIFDPFLIIYNNVGQMIAYDDDGGAGISSLINFTATATGTYFISAEAFTNPGQPAEAGQYDLDVRLVPAVDTVAPIPDASNPTLTVGETYFGSTETSGDADMYVVTLEAGKTYSFETAGGYDYNTVGTTGIPAGREVDTRLALFDEDGNLVAFNDDLNGSDWSSGFSYFASETGSYYLRVFPYAGSIGGYTVDVNEIEIDFTADPLDSIDWGTQLDGNVVTVYFAKAGESFGGSGESLGWSDYEISRAMAALETYENIADLEFVITNDASNATFKMVTVESDDFLGRFGPPNTGAFSGVGEFAVNGDGWDDEGGLEQGGFGFVTLVHEIGHGLGLAHPHDTGGDSTVMEGVFGAFYSFGVFNLNQGVYTTMSYNTGWQTQPGVPFGNPPSFELTYASEGGPSAFDIALIQRKYGANTTRNSGNDTYVLPTQNAPGTFFATIWDTGGTDLIVHNGSDDAIIDLTAATLDYTPTGGGVVSYVDGIYGGFTIANGVVIENASGGSGDDLLVGNAADNVLKGNAGNDVLIGRDGKDTLDGGAGFDTASYVGSAAGVTISMGNNFTGSGQGDRLISIEKVEGSEHNDVLNGGNSADTLSGLGGDDRISGGNAADTIDGGDGNDTLDGGNDNDRIHGGAGNDRVDGGNGNDVLTGGDGNDTIKGGNGNDIIGGGAGDDRLEGGNGNDIFVFGEDGGTDTILDFRRGDVIDLSSLVGVDRSDVTISAGRIFIENGADDITILVQGDRVTDSALVFAGSAGLSHAAETALQNELLV
jgi:Ca2+-binding RTX toxin-like protein